MEAARDAKSPVILQVSQGGAAYFAGKGLANDKQQASIAGAVAAAHHIRNIAPLYGVPVILHSDHCAKKLLPWFDGMLEADEAHHQKTGEPLFSSHMLDLSEETKEENIETCKKYLARMAKIGEQTAKRQRSWRIELTSLTHRSHRHLARDGDWHHRW